MMFKSLLNERPGAISRMLSESYEVFLREHSRHRRVLQRSWRDYDAEIFAHPDTVGASGFTSYLDGRLVGFSSFDPRAYPGRAVIGHNCILPQYRGKGYGVRQLRELLRVLRQKGFRKAVAVTGRHEFFAPALGMYKCSGFRETGKHKVDSVSGLKTVELECDLSIIIRKVTETDFRRVMTLFRQLWPGKALDSKRQRALYQTMLGSDGYELLCAERKGRIVGFSSVSLQLNFWQEGRIAYITTLIVDEACRNQAIGTLLVGHIQELARRRGCGKVELESAFHRQAAHKFYEKMGFEKRAHFFSKDVA